MRTSEQPVLGRVESWSDEQGWGVLLTPSGMRVFCHFSHLDMPGYRTLTPGSSVYFDYEQPGQDGCDARVRTAARLAVASGENPTRHARTGAVQEDHAAYRSVLRIVLDSDG